MFLMCVLAPKSVERRGNLIWLIERWKLRVEGYYSARLSDFRMECLLLNALCYC